MFNTENAMYSIWRHCLSILNFSMLAKSGYISHLKMQIIEFPSAKIQQKFFDGSVFQSCYHELSIRNVNFSSEAILPHKSC